MLESVRSSNFSRVSAYPRQTLRPENRSVESRASYLGMRTQACSLDWESPQFREKPKHVRTWLWYESHSQGSKELAQVSVILSTTKQLLSVNYISMSELLKILTASKPSGAPNLTADWPAQISAADDKNKEVMSMIVKCCILRET